MNICFYTTEDPSVASLLNINYLLQNRPAHTYSFLKIRKSTEPAKGWKDLIIAKYSELRFNDGRFDFHQDLETIKTRLTAHIIPVNNDFRQGFADTVNDELSASFLREVKPDLIIQAGAGIIKPEIFSLAKMGAINLHHGIMPEIRGIESTFWCLFFGMKDKIGVTCHFIDATIDTGAVIAQAYLISASNSFIDLQTENYLMGRNVLLQGIDILDKGGYEIITKEEIESYYFGIVNPFLYYALKKRNFFPIMKITEKRFKLKEKKYVR
jgi:folate-dependent phosphoribosylglycinamide formyltransferase PurN